MRHLPKHLLNMDTSKWDWPAGVSLRMPATVTRRILSRPDLFTFYLPLVQDHFEAMVQLRLRRQTAHAKKTGRRDNRERAAMGLEMEPLAPRTGAVTGRGPVLHFWDEDVFWCVVATAQRVRAYVRLMVDQNKVEARGAWATELRKTSDFLQNLRAIMVVHSRYTPDDRKARWHYAFDCANRDMACEFKPGAVVLRVPLMIAISEAPRIAAMPEAHAVWGRIAAGGMESGDFGPKLTFSDEEIQILYFSCLAPLADKASLTGPIAKAWEVLRRRTELHIEPSRRFTLPRGMASERLDVHALLQQLEAPMQVVSS